MKNPTLKFNLSLTANRELDDADIQIIAKELLQRCVQGVAVKNEHEAGFTCVDVKILSAEFFNNA